MVGGKNFAGRGFAIRITQKVVKDEKFIAKLQFAIRTVVPIKLAIPKLRLQERRRGTWRCDCSGRNGTTKDKAA